MKSIALFLPSLRGGGAERVMVTLANELAWRGYSVDLVLGQTEGPYLKEVSNKVRIIDLGQPRVASCFFKLINYIKSHQPNAMISTHRHANVIAVLARMIARKPMRLCIREANIVKTPAHVKEPLIDRLLPRVMKLTYSHADRVVSNTNGVRDELVSIIGTDPEKTSVIYNPVVSSLLYSHAEEVINHPWLYSDNIPLLVSAGRLTKQKDFPTLLKAFAILRQDTPCRLIILGEGEDREMLTHLAGELGIDQWIDWLGFVNNPFPYFKAADVFVMSSQWEGLCNTLIQALSLGTSIVSTDCPNGPREILNNGEWGKLVPVGSPDKLAIAINQALTDQSFSPERAAEYCQAKFSVTSITDQFLAAIEV